MTTVSRTNRPASFNTLNIVAIILAAGISLTSSFDIFLVIQAGGNFRFCQLLVFPLLLLACWRVLNRGLIPTLGLTSGFVWFCFQLLFVPATDFWPKSLGYCLWLLLNLCTLFSFVQLFGRDGPLLDVLLRCYAWSFGIVAVFGILQFALPTIGIPPPLVQQWWVPDIFPRANGFSYEPSYFATYLLIGLVLANGLRRARCTLFSRWELVSLGILCGAGILVSSSRMGILFLLAELAIPLVMPWLLFLQQAIGLRFDPGTLRSLGKSALGLAALVTVSVGSVLALQRNPVVLLMLLNGTGISDTAAHSVLQREGAMEDTLAVFLDQPLIGTSLGGVSAAIAERHGETISSFEDSKWFEGMNISLEVLAASGLIGAIPFVCFVVLTIRRPWRVAAEHPTIYSPVLQAMVRALIFTWLILQFNQNVLRPYVWVHLSMLASVYSVARRAPRSLLPTSTG
jgi:O-antigen ligase